MESDQNYRHSYLSNTRRDLLPMWIKVFIWIFFVLAAMVPLAVALGFAGMYFTLSLYGIETINPLSLTGFFLIFLFLLKGIVSYGLWTEKDWGVKIALADAILGLIICIFMTLIWPFVDTDEGFRFTFRLEIVVFIPYIMKLNNINLPWAERKNTKSGFEDMIENIGENDTPA